jgi:hypothetical protein
MARSSNSSFVLQLFILTAVFSACLGGSWYFYSLGLYHKWAVVALLFFALVTYFQHRYLTKSAGSAAAAFIRSFIGLTAIKMVLILVAFLVILMMGIPNSTRFAGWYIIFYLGYTILEISALYKYLKKTR